MGFLRVSCLNCGGKWEIYHSNFNDMRLRVCPHCYKEIDSQTWEKQVIPAFGYMQDANRELEKDFLGYPQISQFRVEYLLNKKYPGL